MTFGGPERAIISKLMCLSLLLGRQNSRRVRSYAFLIHSFYLFGKDQPKGRFRSFPIARWSRRRLDRVLA